uniref:Uncharacterized protein n=1 Tax=Oryza meridionalis TaxID=40149 RepID=A0A0E0BY20_9ORYZ
MGRHCKVLDAVRKPLPVDRPTSRAQSIRLIFLQTIFVEEGRTHKEICADNGSEVSTHFSCSLSFIALPVPVLIKGR